MRMHDYGCTLRAYHHRVVDALPALLDVADELATEKVVPSFVNPLAAAIASRS